jgi:alpha-ketoglutarate-dependent taurine dioxygenase
MPLDMQPLSSKLGVAITGVDLSKELDEKLFNEIVDAFVKKQVLFFAINISSPSIMLPSAGGLSRIRGPA